MTEPTELTESAFSVRLRNVTREDHTAAETSEFIIRLMGGSGSALDYVLLLSQYSYVYEALEAEARRLASDAELSAIMDPLLERVPAIHADLAALLPTIGLSEIPAALPITEEYVQRIHDVAATEPARLVGHHYLRYLGDLSGGQAIGKLVGRHYGIAAENLSMWRFEGIEKHKTYKDEYRAKLDAFALTEDRADALIEEAGIGFGLNRKLFGALLEQSRQLTSQPV